jgi:hypothetical protein
VARKGQPEEDSHAGQLEKDSQIGTATMRQAEQQRQKKPVRRGPPGQGCKHRTAKIRQDRTERREQPEKDSQNRAGTRQPEQDRQNRTSRIG